MEAHSTKENLSEDEYWRLYHSHSKEKAPPYLSGKKSFQGEWYRIFYAKSPDFQGLLRKLWADAYRECTERIREVRNSDFRVTCFSNFEDDDELGKNTTMWSHYADGHKGFCVKYSLDLSHSPLQVILKCGLYKVVYSGRIAKVSPRNLRKLQYGEDGRLEINLELAKTIYRALITKARFWNYEKEWRLILGREHLSVLEDGCISFPFAQAVYLGCKIDEGLKRYVSQVAASNGIAIYQARQSSESFKLVFFREEGAGT